jgi:hypothetical protein
MAIEVGTNLAPFQSPVESISAARESGARIGMAIPTQMAAVEQGLDSITENRANSARANILETQADVAEATAPLQVQAAQQQLEQGRDEYARAVRLRQNRDRLLESLKTGDPITIGQALTSGEYADVFVADPKLEAHTARLGYKGLTLSEQKLWLADQFKKSGNDWDRRNAVAQRQKLLESESRFNNSDMALNIWEKFPNKYSSNTEMARDLEAVPAGSYKTEDDPDSPRFGQPLKVGGQRVPMEDFKAGGAQSQLYDIFSRDSGEVLASGVSPKDIEDMRIFRGRSGQMGIGYGTSDTPLTAIAKESVGEKPGVKNQTGPAGAARSFLTNGNPSAPAAAPATQGLPPAATPAAQKPIAITEVYKNDPTLTAEENRLEREAFNNRLVPKEELDKPQSWVPITTRDAQKRTYDSLTTKGVVNAAQDPATIDIFGETLGAPQEFIRQFSPQIATLVRTLRPEVMGATTNLGRLTTSVERKNALDARNKITRSYLSQEYKRLESAGELAGSFDEEAVAAHNENVRLFQTSIRRRAEGATAAPLPPVIPIIANSPEDLYVIQNMNRVDARIQTALDSISEGQRQAAYMQMQKNESAQNSIRAARAYK